MIPVALVFLALVDGALLGFRAGAGRVGLVDKSAHVRRAVRLGLLASAIVALVGVALALGITAFSSPDRWTRLVSGGRAAVHVFGLFAALMLAALSVWLLPFTDLRTFVTVSLLGPGTLVRPLVVVAGMAYAFVRVPTWEVGVLAVYGTVSMLSLERWLTRRFFPVDARLLPPEAPPPQGRTEDESRS
jgi:hypothetical protein